MVVFKNIMSQTDSNYTRLVDKNNSTPLYYGFQKFTVSQEYSVVERSFVGINVEAGTPVAEAALQIPTESNKDLSPFDIIVFNKDPAGLTDEALFKSLDI